MESRQKVVIFQQHGSGEKKIRGIKEYGEGAFDMEIISIDEILPPVLDDTSEYLPADLSCDLVLDFLRHDDLSTDLAALCATLNIPLIASGKKIYGGTVFTPPT